MKYKKIIPIAILCSIFIGCGVDKSEYDKVKKERDEFDASVKQKDIAIQRLRDTISMLSYPASQRIVKINSLVNEGKYNEAKEEMAQLSSLFPESKEAQTILSISTKIEGLIAKQKAEEERIKAMGFKGLKSTLSSIIEYNKVSFSNITVSNSFIFDSYGDEWRYRTADRGNVYVTAVMTITSSSKDPDLPTLAVYSINGDKMNKEGIMDVRFAKWRDYGTYLGNYSDYGNDFAKTSTIRFKLGVEVPVEVTQKPYAVVLKKYNGLSRNNNRYNTPPVSYSGSAKYPYTLSLEDFNKEDSQYVIVKVANL